MCTCVINSEPGAGDTPLVDALVNFTGHLCRHLLPNSDAGALYQMIQEEAARKARMQPRVAPPPPPEEPSGPGVYQAQSRSFRILQKMTEN